jgi:hypothetical protein
VPEIGHHTDKTYAAVRVLLAKDILGSPQVSTLGKSADKAPVAALNSHIYVPEKHELNSAQSYTAVYGVTPVWKDAVFTMSRKADRICPVCYYFIGRKHGDSRIN